MFRLCPGLYPHDEEPLPVGQCTWKLGGLSVHLIELQHKDWGWGMVPRVCASLKFFSFALVKVRTFALVHLDAEP